jgi:DNA-directed RNA polymerase specialized sigma24 family protein
MNGQYAARALPAVASGEPAERLTALFDVHHARLYRLARRLAPSTDDALDLVQETFLRAAQFPKSVPVGATDEEAWLVRVLVNIRRDQWLMAPVLRTLIAASARITGNFTRARAERIVKGIEIQ